MKKIVKTELKYEQNENQLKFLNCLKGCLTSEVYDLKNIKLYNLCPCFLLIKKRFILYQRYLKLY